jgi:hypothetical protein
MCVDLSMAAFGATGQAEISLTRQRFFINVSGQYRAAGAVTTRIRIKQGRESSGIP